MGPRCLGSSPSGTRRRLNMQRGDLPRKLWKPVVFPNAHVSRRTDSPESALPVAGPTNLRKLTCCDDNAAVDDAGAFCWVGDSDDWGCPRPSSAVSMSMFAVLYS